MESIPLSNLAEIARNFARTTNGTKGAFGFNKALEKHLYNSIHQGRCDFKTLTQVAE